MLQVLLRRGADPVALLRLGHAAKRVLLLLVGCMLALLPRCLVATLPPPARRRLAAMVTTTRAAAAQRAADCERLDQVAARLRALPRSQHMPVSDRRAAVLVPLFEDGGGVVRVWLTQRATHLRSHSGEVCLPGGKRDEGDADDAATAAREAEEEMGLPRGRVTVLAQLEPFLSKHRLSVVPVVALVPRDFVPVPSAAEVAAVFSMPLAAFLSAGARHMHYDVRSSRAGSGGGGGRAFRLHSFEHEGQVVWGLTAAIMIRVAQQALGRPADFEVEPSGGRGKM